jgi:hypothetical protein
MFMLVRKAALRELIGKFLVFSSPGYWVVSCTRCDAEWFLMKRLNLPGEWMANRLKHYAEHGEVEADLENAAVKGQN